MTTVVSTSAGPTGFSSPKPTAVTRRNGVLQRNRRPSITDGRSRARSSWKGVRMSSSETIEAR